MLTQTQNYLWTACEDIGEQATEDRLTIDIIVDHPPFTNPDLVELTREDLEGMLEALDDLEKSE